MDQSKLFTEEHIRSMFKMIDVDNNGYVERDELLALLESTSFSMFRQRDHNAKRQERWRNHLKLRQRR